MRADIATQTEFGSPTHVADRYANVAAPEQRATNATVRMT
jgi:hypothetical protein